MNNNISDDVKEAVETGISGEAVTEVIGEIANKEGETPEQFKDTVEIVAEMKNDKPDAFNPEYASNLVQNNSNRIKEALHNGIEPQEIATEITRSSKEVNTEKGKRKITFITKLISKMKRKERKKDLERQQQIATQNQEQLGGIQKVYTYSNQNNNRN